MPRFLIAANNGDLDEIHARLDDYCAGVPQLTLVRDDVYARFSHANYNTGKALAEITRLTGLRREEVFVAGDHLNDLPMLSREFAAFISTPVNAVPSVVQAVSAAGGFRSRLPQGHGVRYALAHFLGEARSNPPPSLEPGLYFL